MNSLVLKRNNTIYTGMAYTDSEENIEEADGAGNTVTNKYKVRTYTIENNDTKTDLVLGDNK